jgi:imidazolonepropionase-like amidohydrolase
MRARTLLTIALGALLVPALLPAQTIAIVGAKIYPVSGPAIEHGTVLMRDGRIVSVGTDVAVPADAQRIDATGKIVTPGLVNAATQIGIVEIGAVGTTREGTARGHDGIAAAFQPWLGLNNSSVLIAPARASGVTTVLVTPSGGLIAGQAAAIHLVPGTASDMTLRAPVAMIATLGPSRGPNPMPRAETIARLRDVLDDARFYRTHRTELDRAALRPLAAGRLDLEALLPVLDGRLPLMIEADKASDIEAAMKLAKDYNFKLIVAGGAEAWQIADKLASAKVPVLTGAMNNIPESFSTLGQRQENAGILSRAGVPVTVVGNAGGGDEEAFNVRNVRIEAGNAVAYGMDWSAALRSITLTPAETFGLADRVGSLAAGKIADVVVWSGDPLEISSQPERVFVRGQEVHELSRQDLLEQRYRTLPPNYKNP